MPDGRPTYILFLTDGLPTQGEVEADRIINNASNNAPPDANNAPVAEAGDNQSIHAGQLVQLDGSGSSDPDGDFLTYMWAQTGGVAVELYFADSAAPMFTTPDIEDVFAATGFSGSKEISLNIKNLAIMVVRI